MKKIKRFGRYAGILLFLILSACNMTPAGSLFSSIAKGSELSVEYAIA